MLDRIGAVVSHCGPSLPADHSVAIERLADLLSIDLKLSRAVSQQGPPQLRRYLAVYAGRRHEIVVLLVETPVERK